MQDDFLKYMYYLLKLRNASSEKISSFCGFYHIPKNPERAEKSAFSSSMTLNFFLPFFRFKYFKLKTLKMSAVLENVKCKELF